MEAMSSAVISKSYNSAFETTRAGCADLGSGTKLSEQSAQSDRYVYRWGVPLTPSGATNERGSARGPCCTASIRSARATWREVCTSIPSCRSRLSCRSSRHEPEESMPRRQYRASRSTARSPVADRTGATVKGDVSTNSRTHATQCIARTSSWFTVGVSRPAALISSRWCTPLEGEFVKQPVWMGAEPGTY